MSLRRRIIPSVSTSSFEYCTFFPSHVRVCFDCYEEDRERLTYKLHRELVWVAHVLLNDDSPIGIEGCKVVTPMEDRDDPAGE